MDHTNSDAAVPTDLSFEAEELAAQKTTLIGRCIALVLIAALTSFLTPWPGPIYFYFLLTLFMLLGLAAYWVELSPWRRSWHRYAFVTADFALLSFTLIYPNPLVLNEYPPQIGLRFGSFVYFFCAACRSCLPVPSGTGPVGRSFRCRQLVYRRPMAY